VFGMMDYKDTTRESKERILSTKENRHGLHKMLSLHLIAAVAKRNSGVYQPFSATHAAVLFGLIILLNTKRGCPNSF
jgi:hypothetical protein